MAAKQSAGLLLYRRTGSGIDVLLAHPGGPFWAKKDAGSWSAPKGEYATGEDALTAAKREFHEETGLPAPDGDYQDLDQIKQAGGKIVRLFALEADLNLNGFTSNTFEMEWPPKSGQTKTFPECDRAAWTPLGIAPHKLVKGQVEFIDRLAKLLHVEPPPEPPTQASLF
ncbi:MAG TPA: NUDIX domain-containing protein [Patescibacteria group bacterium]|nr:NUDIX domain-containing protein [Patescibacteria group bacterium]